jgi:hypothetical protein
VTYISDFTDIIVFSTKAAANPSGLGLTRKCETWINMLTRPLDVTLPLWLASVIVTVSYCHPSLTFVNKTGQRLPIRETNTLAYFTALRYKKLYSTAPLPAPVLVLLIYNFLRCGYRQLCSLLLLLLLSINCKN